MTINIFISHAWRYDDDYNRAVKLLNSAPRFAWRNYSVPRTNPLIANNVSLLKKELDDQIRPSSVVLILAGLYVSYSGWIQYEIDRSVDWGKSIVGIRPWGSQRLPRAVSDAADEIVGWNTSSIVNAIRRLSR